MSLISFILAQKAVNNPVLGPNLQALNGTTFIQGAVRVSILIGLTIGVITFFINLLIGGIRYINSGGDKGKVEAAQSKITNALIGLIIMFSIYMMLRLVGLILGTDLNVFDLSKLQIK